MLFLILVTTAVREVESSAEVNKKKRVVRTNYVIQILATLRKMYCVRWLQLKQDPFLNLETRDIVKKSEIHFAVQKGRLNCVTWLEHFTDSGLSLVNTFLLWLYDPVHH